MSAASQTLPTDQSRICLAAHPRMGGREHIAEISDIDSNDVYKGAIVDVDPLPCHAFVGCTFVVCMFVGYPEYA